MVGANARRKKREREQAQQNATNTNVNSTGVHHPIVPSAPEASTQPPARPVQDAAPSNTTPQGPQRPYTRFNQHGPPTNDTPQHHRPLMPRPGRDGGSVPRPQDAHQSMSKELSKLSVSNASSVLAANYFPIEIGKINVVFQYNLQITRTTPTGDSGKSGKSVQPAHTRHVGRPPHINGNQKARIFWLVLNQLRHQNSNMKIAMATNYKTMIITSAELSGLDLPFDMKIPYYDQFHQSPPHDSPTVFQVRIDAPQRLVFSDLLNDLSSTQPRGCLVKRREDTLTALNVIFGYRPYKDCFVQQVTGQPQILPRYTTSDGGKFYGVVNRNGDATATGPPLTDHRSHPDDCVKSVLGFTRSVRPYSGIQGKLNLNVNTTTALSYPSTGTVADLITLWRQQYHIPNHSLSHQMDLFLTNLRVRTDYRNSQVTDYITSIAGVPGTGTPPTNATWRMHSQNQSGMPGPTIQQYFIQRQCGAVQAGGFVVYIGNRERPIPFPAERLHVIPGQLVKNSIEKPADAIRRPERNRDLILDTGRALFYGLDSPAEGARAFQLSLGSDMLQVPAFRIRAPQIQYRQRIINNQATPRALDSEHWSLQDGAWALRDCSFFTPNRSQVGWTYLVLDVPNSHISCNSNDLDAFRDNFRQALARYGMINFQLHTVPSHRLQLPHSPLPSARQQDRLERQYDVIRATLQKILNAGARFVAIILPSKDQDLYGAVKRAGDVDVGICTLCTVVVKSKPKSSPDFFANLSLKVNLKTNRNTVNQSLKVKGPILTTRTMIMGIDVTHPGANAMIGAPSIAAVVGSIDSEFAQWPANFGAVFPNLKKESKEEVDNLDDLVYKRIKDYWVSNKAQPDKIIIYRDGLSEGQFEMCKTKEYGSIQKGLDKFALESGLPKPKILLICAVKRHHTRLFPIKGRKDDSILDRNGNPRPGTLVSDLITYGNGEDFFLVSHMAIQGTARPTHYVVLKNDLEQSCSLEEIAQMTHNLCYLFGRATRSVGVCPPAYYADLAADRVRVWVRRFYNASKVDGQRQNYDRGVHDAEFVGRLLAEHRNLQGTMFYI